MYKNFGISNFSFIFSIFYSIFTKFSPKFLLHLREFSANFSFNNPLFAPPEKFCDLKILRSGFGPDFQILVRIFGHFSPDLVWILEKKWSGFGPDFRNCGPEK